MHVVKTVAFTDGLVCERCFTVVGEHDHIAMLVESLTECGNTAIWCLHCADEVAAHSGDMDWVKGAHYSCMRCHFVIETSKAEEMGWIVDPAGIGVYCFFCAYESAEGPNLSIPLSCSTNTQEVARSKRKGRKLILWAAGLLQVILMWDIGIDWLIFIPSLGLGYTAVAMLKLHGVEMAFPPFVKRKRGTK